MANAELETTNNENIKFVADVRSSTWYLDSGLKITFGNNSKGKIVGKN